MNNELTSEDFWSNYWGTIELPVTVDHGFKNDRVIAAEIKKALREEKRQLSALEIGCAPGKWISFMALELGCQVNGIEYLKIAADKTVENLKIQNIKDFDILSGDFFTYPFNKQYDVVMSFGFIEHFDNFDKVLEDQLKLVATNGYLIMGIPRFRGVNFLLQKAMDYFLEDKLIPSHNLKTMNLKNYEVFAKKNNLKIVCNKFIGGFESGLFPVAKVHNMPMRVVFKIIMRLLRWTLGRVDANLISSYQIAIFKKF